MSDIVRLILMAPIIPFLMLMELIELIVYRNRVSEEHHAFMMQQKDKEIASLTKRCAHFEAVTGLLLDDPPETDSRPNIH